MAVRLIALLLAVFMTAGTVAPTALASSNVASLVDDGMLDLEPALTVSSVALEVPARGELGPIVVVPLSERHGRLYQISVFRPPRQIASR